VKYRCRKWPRMGHLDIYSTSYGKKKGRESNWQFDSRPLKVENRPNPDVCRWSVTHRWKALKDNYKFALDFITIRSLSKELWSLKVPGVQIGTISRLLLGRHIIYYMGEGGGFPRVWAVVSQVSPRLPVACPSTQSAPKGELTNLLIGLV